MINSRQIEAIEIEAWQSMFDAAPPIFKQETGLYYKNIGGGTCLVFPKYPVLHFNMVMGLGLAEPASEPLLMEVESIYKNAGQSTFMIQYIDGLQQSSGRKILENMGYKIKGGWERITWENKPLVPMINKRDILVRTVEKDTADAWEKFVLDIYKYPAHGWLKSLHDAKGWKHFFAGENGRTIACRSLYIGSNWGLPDIT